jgi:hypothetical protein
VAIQAFTLVQVSVPNPGRAEERRELYEVMERIKHAEAEAQKSGPARFMFTRYGLIDSHE